ncbi:MAG: iron ABC transporter permease [Spirochaetia bacterium]|nr:iron ABC transporter permease [Spirochaetia bacterium]
MSFDYRKETFRFTSLLAYFGIFLLVPLFILPIFMVLRQAFLTNTNTFSFSVFSTLLKSSYIWRIIGFTTLQALLSTVSAILIGLPGSYLISQFNFKGKFIIRAISAVPFVLPSIIVVLGFVIFYGNNGFLNNFLMKIFNTSEPPLKILYSFKAIIFAHAFYNFPICINLIAGYWEQVSDNSELASYTMGAKRCKTFFSITLPKIYPAILSSAALIFLFCFTSFAIILVLGGGPWFTTIEVEIFRQARVSFDLHTAAGLAIISITISSVILLIYLVFQKKMMRNTAGFKRPIFQHSTLLNPSKITSIIIVLYITAAVLFVTAPIISVIFRSFQTQLSRGSSALLSLKWYKQLFSVNQGTLSLTAAAFKNSLLLAITSAAVAIPAAIGLSYFTISVTPNKSYLPELLFMLPLAVSSVILGLGYYLLSNITGTMSVNRLLIVAAHAIITLPFILRSVMPALRNMRQTYSSAALSLGAKPVRVFFSIELPLLKNAIISGSVFAVAISFGEINATLILADENTITIPILLYRLIGSYNFYAACAVGTLLVAMCIILFSVFEYLREKL